MDRFELTDVQAQAIVDMRLRALTCLLYTSEINFIREQAKQRSYENLESILDSIQKTKVRLKANVNFDLAFELLFLTIREK